MTVLEGARERRVRTGGVELCVAELGDPRRPTVVLVHGYPDSKEVWSEVAARLAGRFHVVLYASAATAGRARRARCGAASRWRS